MFIMHGNAIKKKHFFIREIILMFITANIQKHTDIERELQITCTRYLSDYLIFCFFFFWLRFVTSSYMKLNIINKTEIIEM